MTGTLQVVRHQAWSVKTAWIATYLAGTFNISNMISVMLACFWFAPIKTKPYSLEYFNINTRRLLCTSSPPPTSLSFWVLPTVVLNIPGMPTCETEHCAKRIVSSKSALHSLLSLPTTGTATVDVQNILSATTTNQSQSKKSMRQSITCVKENVRNASLPELSQRDLLHALSARIATCLVGGTLNVTILFIYHFFASCESSLSREKQSTAKSWEGRSPRSLFSITGD